MSNRRELQDARRKAEHALFVVEAIERLPRRKGSMILWSNGVIWRRVGDDEWEPLHRADSEYIADREQYGVFGSAHVATSAGNFSEWTQIKTLPSGEPS